MWQYNYTNYDAPELYHYGVKGMRWGHRKAIEKYQRKARISSDSAKEWDEMADYAEQRGKTKRAAKYRKYAAEDRANAERYTKVAKANSVIREERVAIGKTKAKRLMLTIGVAAAATGAVVAGKKIAGKYADAKIGRVVIDKGTEFVQGYRR